MKKVTSFRIIEEDEIPLNDEDSFEGEYLSKFFRIIQEQNSYANEKDEFDELKDTINLNLKNINKALEKSDRILAWGDVQSGKTNNIIALSLDSLDKGYDVVIILGGVNSTLFNQTDERFKVMKFQEIKDFAYYNKDNLKNGKIANVIENEKKVIINTMKENTNLERLKDSLSPTDLSNKRIMLIDDESDFGSINIEKKPKNEESHSALFNSILELFKRAKNNKLVLVTATPYANIISKKTAELKPSLIVKLICSKEYTGNNFFNKIDAYYDSDISKANLVNKESEVNKSVMIKIIKNGLNWYIFSSALLRYKYKIFAFELLINIDLVKGVHQEIEQVVNKQIRRLKNLWDYSFALNNFKEQIDYYKNYFSTASPSNEFIKCLREIIDKTEVFLFNSDNEKNKGYNSKDYKSVVIVGGTMASRGFTFQNLVTEIMLNAPTLKIAADTLLQRARWFGYRRKNNWYKFIKVLTNCAIQEAFFEIEELDNLITQEMDENNLIKVNDDLIDKFKNRKFKHITITSGVKK